MNNPEIKIRRVVDLKPHPRNSKKHPREQLEKIAESIRKFGFNNPILVDKDLQILAGHGRVEACEILGLDEVPTIMLDHLTPAEARAYLIADNKVSESDWDVKALCEELFELSHEGFDGLDLGFSDLEMEKLMKTQAGMQDEELAGLDSPLEDYTIAITPGQIWKFGKHKVLIAGRRLDLERLWEILDDVDGPPMFLYLLERQAKSTLARWEKRRGEKPSIEQSLK